MSDDAFIPMWKRNQEKLRTPEANAKRVTTKKVMSDLRRLLHESLDELGGKVYLKWLAREEPAAYSALLGKLLPLEVQGQIDHSLTVKIVTQTGGREIVIDGGKLANLKLPPKDAVTGERLPVATQNGDA